ncbi:hypothetical protein AGMMS50267_11440 [Spirochaetia bacterium]|nr:hypothetical protein AGMMS50267_11440 [Spirochaetia bacterium]
MTVVRRNLTLAAVLAAMLMAFAFAGCPAALMSVIPLPGEDTILVQPPQDGKAIPATGVHYMEDTSILVFNGQDIETLTAVVSPADATLRTVYWASSNPLVATVRGATTGDIPFGTVVPHGVGEAKIYAQVSDGKGDYYTATCLIKVLKVPEVGIVIEGAEIDQYKRLAIPAPMVEKYISARVLHGTGDVTWSISDAADPVVLLNNGLWDPLPTSANAADVTITGRKAGTAYLTATSAEGKTDTIMVTVSAIAVDTIEITKPNGDLVTNLSIAKGTSLPVMAKLTPNNTTYTVVKWAVASGTDIVDLSTDTTSGSELVTITAKTAGTALIRATSEDGKTATCIIRVPLTLTPPGMTLILDTDSFKKRTLTASAAPGDVSWSISNAGIATYTVDPQTGVVEVTGVTAGQTTLRASTIWADSDGQHLTAECLVTVLTTFAGKTLTLNVPITYTGTAPANPPPTPSPTVGEITLVNPPLGIHWENENTDVADLSVSTNVTVTAKATGQTFVMALNADNSLYEMYLVIVPLRFEYASRTIAKGVTELLNTTVDDVNTDKLDWTSSNTSVATVDTEGRVTALTAGKTVITAVTKDGRQTASCMVTVPLTLSPAALTLFLDEPRFKTRTLTASIAVGQAIWANSNPTVATYVVDAATGELTVEGLAAGTTTITVTTVYNGDEGVPLTAQCVVRVLDTFVGQTVTLNAPIQYPAGYLGVKQTTPPAPTSEVLNQPAGSKWNNDDPGIASLNTDTGTTVTVSAVSAGTTFLLVEDSVGGPVTMYRIDVPIRLEENAVEVELTSPVKSDKTLYTTVADANKSKIVWTSDDDSIAGVDSDGKVTGNGVGTTTIHAAYNGVTVDCEVTVPLAMPLTLFVDETSDLTTLPEMTGLVLPADTVWVSPFPGFVTVDQDGKVTGIKSTGSVPVLVTASVDDHMRVKCSVNVVNRTLTVIPAGMTMSPGESTTGLTGLKPDLNYTIDPAYDLSFDPALLTPLWYSDNPTVVAVDQSGHVTALRTGAATVWVVVRGARGYCEVNIPSIKIAWDGDNQDHNGEAIWWWKDTNPLSLTAAISDAPAGTQVRWSINGPADAVVFDGGYTGDSVAPAAAVTIKPGVNFGRNPATVTAALDGYPGVNASFTINPGFTYPVVAITRYEGYVRSESVYSISLGWANAPAGATESWIDVKVEEARANWKKLPNPLPYSDDDVNPDNDSAETIDLEVGYGDGSINLGVNNLVINRYWPPSLGTNRIVWMNAEQDRLDAFTLEQTKINDFLSKIEASPLYTDGSRLKALHDEMADSIRVPPGGPVHGLIWSDGTKKTLKLPVGAGSLYEYYMGYVPGISEYVGFGDYPLPGDE